MNEPRRSATKAWRSQSDTARNSGATTQNGKPFGTLSAARIGVVAAAEFDRRLDQKAAGVIADRAERIVIDLEPLARRLAITVPAIAGGSGALLASSDGGIDNRNNPAASTGGGAGPDCRVRAAVSAGLARIGLRLLAGAIERVEAGIGGAVGGGKAIGRDLPDPRRRGGVPVARWRMIDGSLESSAITRWFCATASPAARRSHRVPGGTGRGPASGPLRRRVPTRPAQGMATARGASTRGCGGPWLDPTSRWEYSNEFIRLTIEFHARRSTPHGKRR